MAPPAIAWIRFARPAALSNSLRQATAARSRHSVTLQHALVASPLMHAKRFMCSPCSTSRPSAVAASKDCTPCETTCNVVIDKDTKCWQCNSARRPARCAETLFCNSCGHIQPPAPSCNYFELMGLSAEDERFDLDLKQLEANYKRLMTKLHPDRFMTKMEQEIEFSQAQCSTVNVAYSTLRCPFRRAKYMLRRMGVDFEDGTSNTDPEFMMEVLEASSEIEDASRDQARLSQVRDEFYVPRLTTCELDFAAAYVEGDVQRAAAATARLQYLKRVKEQLREVVDLN